MTQHTLEELERTAQKRRRTFQRQQNDRYHLARSLGFPPMEAVILQNWSEETIRALAKERGYPNVYVTTTNLGKILCYWLAPWLYKMAT